MYRPELRYACRLRFYLFFKIIFVILPRDRLFDLRQRHSRLARDRFVRVARNVEAGHREEVAEPMGGLGCGPGSVHFAGVGQDASGGPVEARGNRVGRNSRSASWLRSPKP